MKENLRELNISRRDEEDPLDSGYVLSRGTTVQNPYSEFDYEENDANTTPLAIMSYASFKVSFAGDPLLDVENFLRLFGKIVQNGEMLLLETGIETFDNTTTYWVNIFGWSSSEWSEISLDVAKTLQGLHAATPVFGAIGSLDAYHDKAEVSIKSMDWENGQRKWVYKANANIMWANEAFTNALRDKHKASAKTKEYDF